MKSTKSASNGCIGSQDAKERSSGVSIASVDTDDSDDVQFPDAVVLVGTTHWSCISCAVLHPRTVSIDQHIQDYHKQPNSPPVVAPVHERGQDRGGGLIPEVSTYPSTKSAPESEQKSLRLSACLVQSDEDHKAGHGRGNPVRDSQKASSGRGRGLRGSKSSRGGRGRGRGKVFTGPLTSEDSDTEIETLLLSTPSKLTSSKRKTPTSAEPVVDKTDLSQIVSSEQEVKSTDNRANSPPSKKARVDKIAEDNTPSSDEMHLDNPLPTPGSTAEGLSKDLVKEKYVVFVEKAGTSEYLSETEVHIDNDPPLPIETPSLQADTLLPPATPLLPDIHGPPETPAPPETPHPPEIIHQPSPSPDHQTDGDGQDSIHSHGILQSVTPGIVSTTAPPTLATKSDVQTCVQVPLVTGEQFSAFSAVENKPDGKQLGSSTVCRTCGAGFDSPEELRSHREEMIKFDIMSCNSCGDKFHGLHQLNIHVFTTHEKFAKKFCFLCDVDCLDGFELEEHLLEHTMAETDHEDDTNDIDSIQHTCKTCGTEVEGNLSDLVNHYHTTHDQLVCTKCYELFTDLTEYEDHKMLHSSNADASVVYSCPVSDCFQLCENKEALMDHISWHEDRDVDEEDMNLLQCQQCKDQFRNTTSLLHHLAETHNEPDLRPFVCELCGEAYSHSLELHQHNTIHHAGIKRYGCAYCEQRFAFRSAHRRHVASEHDVPATVLRM